MNSPLTHPQASAASFPRTGEPRWFVTAFPGARDSYQIPLALAEQGRLAAFVTCFYRNRGMIGRLPLMGRRLRSRHVDGVADESIECLELTDLGARLARRILQPSRIGVWEDIAFARRAVDLARSRKASLFLYEFQADWAFRQPMRHDAARILFQFHPHPDLEHPLLLADGERYPLFLEGIRRNTRMNLANFYRQHTRRAWEHADHVIVASRFTALSLQRAGCPAERVTVVPYGCNLGRFIGGADRESPDGRPFFLFVGSGTHRKGLHHLIEAWARSRLQDSHDLVVIARVVEPELRSALAAAPSVRHIHGTSAPDLARWYATAKAFVLPSLSEGFGHVYMEALACGCPVIGTRNSVLPDVAEAQPHIRYVDAGEPESIRAELEAVAQLPADDPFFRTQAVRESVKQWTWNRFRGGIESVLARFDR